MKRILVATDQGEFSDLIVKAGLGLAAKLNLSVDLVTIVEQSAVFSEPNTGIILTEAYEDQYQMSERNLLEIKNSNPDLDIVVHCQSGDPKDVLLEDCHEEGVCMMVIGTHTHSHFGSLRMGKTAEYIIGHVGVPVLVVPLKGNKLKPSGV
jgi:nucleotide-binding universal stress UspA family protein